MGYPLMGGLPVLLLALILLSPSANGNFVRALSVCQSTPHWQASAGLYVARLALTVRAETATRWRSRRKPFNLAASLISSGGGESDASADLSAEAASFDAVVRARYACTRFLRNDEYPATPSTAAAKEDGAAVVAVPAASLSNPDVVRTASEVLNLARRAPSGFNAQPYRAVLVHSRDAKERLARYCMGRNADRVRDSDCTVVFLADRECGRDLGRFGGLVRERDDALVAAGATGRRGPMTNWVLRKIQVLVLLFSSGYPLPRIFASPLAFFVRAGVAAVSVVTRRRVLVPSLASAETWSTKNAMLFAMTYVLGCTSRGLATCPMEGHNAGGVRKALGVPRRFAVPLIVSTGLPYVDRKGREDSSEESDDVGMSHGGLGSKLATNRFPAEEVLFEDAFGTSLKQ